MERVSKYILEVWEKETVKLSDWSHKKVSGPDNLLYIPGIWFTSCFWYMLSGLSQKGKSKSWDWMSCLLLNSGFAAMQLSCSVVVIHLLLQQIQNSKYNYNKNAKMNWYFTNHLFSFSGKSIVAFFCNTSNNYCCSAEQLLQQTCSEWASPLLFWT